MNTKATSNVNYSVYLKNNIFRQKQTALTNLLGRSSNPLILLLRIQENLFGTSFFARVIWIHC